MPTLPEAPLFRVAFTHNQHGAPEATCQRPICRSLLAAITHARHSIDFAVYGLRAQPALIDALVAAQKRGVRVRGVVDTEDATCSRFGYSDTPTLITRLGPGSVVCDVGAGFRYIMHHKFFVFDASDVWTGSTNASDTELGGEYSADVAVLIHAPELAAIYGHEFAEMFAGRFHSRKRDDTPHYVELADGSEVWSYFSPSDHALQRAVIPFIERARRSLDIAMFFFTDPKISEALVHAGRRGVHIRMVLDASGAANAASKHPALCDIGVPVKVENWGGKSHSKWAVADGGTKHARVLFGSMNWTTAGDRHNDENTLVVHNQTLAAEFQSEFERQWTDLSDTLICPDPPRR